MIFKLIARIQFLVTSTNQHGVHSPFVFDFVTKGLYQKTQDKKDFLEAQNLTKKEVKLLIRICNYFKIDQLYTHPKKLENTLDNQYKILLIKNIDTYILDESLSKIPKLCLIFTGIYANSNSKQQWQLICQHTQATVTIDLFVIGLVFFRKEQEKEHFKIRV